MGKIFIASKPVALGKEHLYLVYDPNEAVNGDEEVIRGGPFRPMEAPNLVDPDHGNIFLDAGRLLTESHDDFGDGETRTSQNFTELSIPIGETAETLWGKLVNSRKRWERMIPRTSA